MIYLSWMTWMFPKPVNKVAWRRKRYLMAHLWFLRAIFLELLLFLRVGRSVGLLKQFRQAHKKSMFYCCDAKQNKKKLSSVKYWNDINTFFEVWQTREMLYSRECDIIVLKFQQ